MHCCRSISVTPRPPIPKRPSTMVHHCPPSVTGAASRASCEWGFTHCKKGFGRGVVRGALQERLWTWCCSRGVGHTERAIANGAHDRVREKKRADEGPISQRGIRAISGELLDVALERSKVGSCRGVRSERSAEGLQVQGSIADCRVEALLARPSRIKFCRRLERQHDGSHEARPHAAGQDGRRGPEHLALDARSALPPQHARQV
eukprot:5831482-Prymnesium_polylepis.1